MQPRHTARGLVIRGDDILLMERWRNDEHYFSIPGGGIEADESPEQTVVREIDEETTVKVTVECLVIVAKDKDREHRIYVCRYESGEPVLSPTSPESLSSRPNNKFKPQWVPKQDLKDIPLVYWEPLRAAVLDGLQNGFPDQPIMLTM